MKKLVALTVLGLALAAPSSGQADVTFQYVTDASSYSAAAGTVVNVNVYLQETDTNGSSSILAAKNGLTSFGVYVTQSAGASSGQSTIVTGNNGSGAVNGYTTATPFTEFTSAANTSSSPSSLPANSIDYFNANNSQVANGQTTSTGYKVFVGTVNITAGTQTTFTLASLNSSVSGFNDPGDGGTAGSDSTFTLPASNPLDLDSDGSGFHGANDVISTFTVSPTAAPEPSSMLLCGMVVAGAGFFGYRRRNKKTGEEVADLTADVV